MLKVLTVALILLPAPSVWAADATVPPPYQADMLRFSEILGALTYLDGLCTPTGAPKTDDWRAKMAALIEAQGFDGTARRPYVEAFNRGQRTFAAAHRSCSSSARSLVQRYLTEGAELADRIGQRFGRQDGNPAEPAKR